MSADAVSMGVFPTHTASFNEVEQNVRNLEELISEFGVHEVASVMANSNLEQAIKEMKKLVQDSDLPQSVKDSQLRYLDESLATMRHPVSPCAEEAVGESMLGDHAEGGSAHEGGAPSVDAVDMALAANQMHEESKESSEGGRSKKGGNWLVELAKGLAEIQNKFLTEALDNLKIMEANADAMNADTSGGQSGGDGKQGEFLMAQAKYQASMQMFNMMANMTATSLKTLGEGLTAIARKQ